MSGFAGIVRLEPTLETAEADSAALARMAAAIAFRGPDAQQQWQRDGASFAFSLLTTGPAPQSPSQPVTLDGETWLLGDVRCDGRDELIEKLDQHGIQASPDSTSEELILHFCAKFGEEALPELHGDFSFVLWKPKERRLIAFRDLSGCRPLFYAHRDRTFLFSNTLQAVLAHPRVARNDYDLQFMANLLLGSPYHDPIRTVYSDIRRLPPGSLLEFSSQALSTRRVANLPIEGLLSSIRDEEVLEEFRRLFRQSVRDRLPRTGTTIFLSGGLDSTTIATTAAGLRRESPDSPSNLRALSLDLRPLFRDDEGLYATRFATALGIPIQLLQISHILPFDGMDETSTFLPEPPLGLYWMRQPFYYSKVAQSSRVALTGDGGDEILRGHAGAYIRHGFSESGYTAVASALLSYVISSHRLPALGLGIRSWLLRLAGRPPVQPTFPAWFTSQAHERFLLQDRFAQISAPAVSPHPFHPRAYALFNNEVLAAGMEEQDPTWTGCAIECRSPFFDRRLLRFLLRLPPLPWFMEKDLIRRAMKGALPEEIRLRRKAPLPRDPLLMHLATGAWSPRAPAECPEPLSQLVNWPLLLDCLRNSSDNLLRLQLRPVVVAVWLKAVENNNLIQYSQKRGLSR